MKKLSYKLASILIVLLAFSCSKEPKPRVIEETATVKTTTDDKTSAFLKEAVLCGTVQFEDGCNPQLDSIIAYGLALVHHMTYTDAAEVFQVVIDEDPDCFWGHWGKALTYIHPLWPDVPSREQMMKGKSLVEKAKSLATNERETLFVEALAAYYLHGHIANEKDRLKLYQEGWQKASDQRPDDIEAELFANLTRLAIVSPSDKSYTVQKDVGAQAELVLNEIPDHPGAFHYAIHAYDYPALANRAIRVSNEYSKVAPEVPHALHMPTHIFIRLGYWNEAIDWNLRSAKAAKGLPAHGQVSLHYFHAIDYLVYAYLQIGEDKKAMEWKKSLDTLSGPYQSHAGTGYALAAIPARIHLERKEWEEAAQLELVHEDLFAWEKFPHLEALTWYGKGIGAARSGQTDIAMASMDRMSELIVALGDDPSVQYWANRIEIQRTAVDAWNTYISGNKEDGLGLMIKAAEMEDLTEKNPITPGELLPVKEMLGDMYLDYGKPREAFDTYVASLENNPNRFNTYYGAALAAGQIGDKENEQKYYNLILEMAVNQENRKEVFEKAKNVTAAKI